MSEPQITSSLSAGFLLQYRGPCVYLWMRGSDILYVGNSQQVLGRLSQHGTIGKREHLQATDVLEVHHCGTVDEMLALEKKLIWRYCPSNTAGIPLYHKKARKYERRAGL